MDSYVSLKDEIWFVRLCHHISTGLYSFLLGVRSTHGHSAAGRIKSIKNPNDPIGNRTPDLLACSALPQPAAPPRTPDGLVINKSLNKR